jgi:hemerythrin superfamily protein
MTGQKSGLVRQPSKESMRSGTKINAIKLLKSDHQKVKDLFDQYEMGDSTHQKGSIAEQIFMELDLHSQLEEEIFYPAVESAMGQEGREMVEESLEEHRAAKKLIEELRSSDIESEYYDERIHILMDDVEHHIEEEEGKMFPDAEEMLGADLERLGMEMEKRKDQLMAVR